MEPKTQRSNQQQLAGFGHISPLVFWSALSCILCLIILSFLNATQALHIFEHIQRSISDTMGWFFVLCVNVFLGVVLYLCIGKYGVIRLGGPTATPDFSYWGWFTMLFSAGRGIGLVFWSVSEPINHYISPPMGPGGTSQAAELAMSVTLLHW